MNDPGRPRHPVTRAYAWLLRAYPPRFRRLYGEAMVEIFERRRAEAARRGPWAAFRWSATALVDVLLNAPPERLASRRSMGPRFAPGRHTRYAFRQIVRQPGFSFTLVLTLGLGTGATAAFFAVVDAALLRPLPYPDADRLVLVRQVDRELGAQGFGPPQLRDLRAASSTLDGLAGFSPSWELTLTDPGAPRVVTTAYVSDGIAGSLGIRVVQGRIFDASEHAPGGPPVVLVGMAFWSRHFGPGAMLGGQTVRLEGTDHVVVGVAERLDLPITSSTVSRDGEDAELWLPFALNPYAELTTIPVMHVIARLPSSGSLAAVRAELPTVASALAEGLPGRESAGLVADALVDVVSASARGTVLTLFGAAVLLLLIACANVVNLLMARATARTRELAVRRSLGAGPLELLMQLFTESLVIAVLGGAMGVFLAWGLLTAAAPMLPGLPPTAEIRLDARLVAFATSVVLGSAIVFGLVPALHAGSTADASLRAGGRAVGGADRLRRVFVTAQVALAVTLLIGAGLLGRSFWNLVHVDPGFRVQELVQIPVPLSSPRYATDEARVGFIEEVLSELASVPGITSAAAVNRLPLGGENVVVGIEINGVPFEHPPLVDRRVVTPGYFDLMAVPLVQGRAFSVVDAADGTVAMVNEVFAHRLLAGTEAVGARVRLMLRGSPGPWLEVVGVAADVRHHGLDRSPEPEIYVPYTQAPVEGMTLLALAERDASDMLPPARSAVWRIDADLPLDRAARVSEVLRRSVEEPRTRALVLNGFAALALLLSGVGVYGVIAYTVARRTRELGVRMALGARRTQVVAGVVREALSVTAAGAALGLVGGLLVGRLLAVFLFGVAPADPLTVLAVLASVFGTSLVASYLPARRAASIDPARALDAE